MSDAKAFQVVWDLPQVVVWLTSETTRRLRLKHHRLFEAQRPDILLAQGIS